MKRPTITSTGAVATDGMRPKTGEKTRKGRHSSPTPTAVRPDRPPAFTPAADSMYEVPDELPTIPDRVVETPSTSIALPTFFGVPSASCRPATFVTPTKVEIESNMSV